MPQVPMWPSRTAPCHLPATMRASTIWARSVGICTRASAGPCVCEAFPTESGIMCPPFEAE
eukprot:4785298-Lingulodinium_polyedra.AAC.1